MEPDHLRVDLAVSGSRAQAEHESTCPDIGPICDVRDEPPQRHETTLWLSEVRLLAEYGLLDRLALQAAVPLRIVDTRTEFTDLAGDPIELDYESIHHRDETLVGLGDVQLLLHGGARARGVGIGWRAGVSAPTGEVHENPFRLGDEGKPHEHIQFGTGTFDPVLGIDAGRSLGAWSLSGFAQTQLPIYEGPRGYMAGARLQGGVAGSRTLGRSGVSARLALTALHEWPERWDSQVPDEDGNRGRTDLFLGPGVTIPLGADTTASLDVGARIYGHAVGAQLDMPLVVSVSIGRLFHLERGAHVEPLPAGSGHGDVADAVRGGEAVPLVPATGKWTVFDFWATWCESCGDLDRRLRALALERADLAVRRVNIVDLDSPISTQELRGVTQLPHVRLVTPDGRTVWEASGRPADLMEGIRDRIGGSP